ncbi:MAG: hypothetical protein ACQETH_09225 [Candidatus Rifleibacteriota bacterium]
MKIRIFILLTIILIAMTNHLYSAKLAIGFDADQIGILNSSDFKGPVGLAMPYGPQAIKNIDETTKILDSVGRKIVTVDKEGKVLDTLDLKSIPKQYLPIDFCISDEGDKKALWLLGNNGKTLIKLSLEGKVIGVVKSDHDFFKEAFFPDTIHAGPEGQIIISDSSLKKIAIMDKNAKLIRTIDMVGESCFVNSKHEIMMVYHEFDFWNLRKVDINGKLINDRPIWKVKADSIKIVGVFNNSDFLIHYQLLTPQGPIEKVARCNGHGELINVSVLETLPNSKHPVAIGTKGFILYFGELSDKWLELTGVSLSTMAEG